jgi:hypothetical protein
VRYAVFSGLAILLVTIFHPIVAFGITMIIAVLALILAPSPGTDQRLPELLRATLYSVLPSTRLLSEDRFFTITQASLKQIGWLGHMTTLEYGLDYALVCLLLAIWSFHYRTLTRD